MPGDVRAQVDAHLQALSPSRQELFRKIVVERAARSNTIKRRPPEELGRALPSYGQERIWFMDRFIPYRTAFCIPSSLRLLGPLNAEALEWALNAIVER